MLLSVTRVLAWDAIGHQTVSRVALSRMTPAAVSRLEQILRGDSPAPSSDSNLVDILDEASTWMDRIVIAEPMRVLKVFAPFGPIVARDSHRSHLAVPMDERPLVVGPIAFPGGATGDLLLDHARAVLADSASPLDLQVEALKCVLHLVADLHQPLHCGRVSDLCGFRLLVDLPPEGGALPRRTPLHNVWDNLPNDVSAYPSILVTKCMVSLSPKEVALACNDLDSQHWVLESRAVALADAYTLPNGKPVETAISSAYLAHARVVAIHQMGIAGVRLAAVLNAIFDPAPSTL